MKLKIGRTVLAGLAFFAICAFWQLYNNIIPLILKQTFDLNEVVAGTILAADNVLALFMLPLFGMLSDKTNTKLGKRIPYIIVGTILSVALLMLLAVFNDPARLAQFVVVLALLLMTMNIFRSPAVSLMPDVTPKPLLSEGNATINLLGTFAGLLTLGLIIKLSPSDGDSYYMLFGAIAAIMIVSILILVLTFKENKFREEKKALSTDDKLSPLKAPEEYLAISKAKKKSLILLLISVFLWFFGFNAITSAYSKFAVIQWGLSEGLYAQSLLIAQGVALVSFIPLGIVATKFGRKRTIIIGIIGLTICFACIGLFREYNKAIPVLLSIAGIGWAAITVNSYPMVISLGKGDDIGKYTGYYYTASMASQVITPITSGILLEYAGYWTLFPYSAFFIALSAITMIYVKHGDTKPIAKKTNILGQ